MPTDRIFWWWFCGRWTKRPFDGVMRRVFDRYARDQPPSAAAGRLKCNTPAAAAGASVLGKCVQSTSLEVWHRNGAPLRVPRRQLINYNTFPNGCCDMFPWPLHRLNYGMCSFYLRVYRIPTATAICGPVRCGWCDSFSICMALSMVRMAALWAQHWALHRSGRVSRTRMCLVRSECPVGADDRGAGVGKPDRVGKWDEPFILFVTETAKPIVQPDENGNIGCK